MMMFGVEVQAAMSGECFRCTTKHPFAASLEEWIDTKDFSLDKPAMGAKGHVPTEDEINFANELLSLHFEYALNDLLTICQSKIHSDPGDEKDHLKVTLLRVDSSLQGVLSCLPDFRSTSENGMVNEAGSSPFLIAGATGSCVGSSELRQKAADIIHETCKYLLKEKSDVRSVQSKGLVVSSSSTKEKGTGINEGIFPSSDLSEIEQLYANMSINKIETTAIDGNFWKFSVKLGYNGE